MADDFGFIRPTNPVGDQHGGTSRFPRKRTLRAIADGSQLDEDTASFLPSTVPEQDPTRPLIEALDRLRVVGEVRPAELEYARALRGLRQYEETTRVYARENDADATGLDGETRIMDQTALRPQAPGTPALSPQAQKPPVQDSPTQDPLQDQPDQGAA